MKTICPHCGQEYEVDIDFAGKNAECQMCKSTFMIKEKLLTESSMDVIVVPRKKTMRLILIFGALLLCGIISLIIVLKKTEPIKNTDAKFQGINPYNSNFILPETIQIPTNKKKAPSQISTDSQSHSKNSIDGAFGIKLGQVFDPATAVKIEKDSDTERYEFIPENKFRDFNQYFVEIVPSSKKVYSINAQKFNADFNEREIVTEIIEKKYGKVHSLAWLDDAKEIQDKNRFIRIIWGGTVNHFITIHYVDQELKKNAEQERISAEVKKTNDSML